MCKWAAWSGNPKYLEELICDPEHSLIEQSRHAASCSYSVNAVGFGAAWYDDRVTPCIYKDVRPAWTDPNLLQLAHHVKASVFLAHVRVSTSAATARDNCHPFSYGRWSFMHNGMIGGYDRVQRRVNDVIHDAFYDQRIKRQIDHMIPDALFDRRLGTTDSEVIFLIALGCGLDSQPIFAMARAVGMLENLSETRGGQPAMRFAACWS
ncbi:class II glutamine amidotransferase, partial [Roseibium sp. RKSG952]|uniref:class II glutamine amidotransferase n=1 Tax=Roseibium sp. RKSG952 TaxID=2529384 RepID=UPI0012BCF574